MLLKPYRGNKSCDLYSQPHPASVRLKLARTDAAALFVCHCHFDAAVRYLRSLQHEDTPAIQVPPCTCAQARIRTSRLSAFLLLSKDAATQGQAGAAG